VNLTRSEKVRLGAFVAVGLTVLGGSVVTLAGLKAFETRDLYTVRFAESVAGLEVSAQVKYQGLRVGRVDAMRIDPTDPKRVEVTLSLEAGTALYEGTRAALEMSGITGLKIINLTPGDPRLPKLAVGAEIPPSQSFFERITGQAEAIVLKVETVVGNLAAWTGPETRGKVTDVLDNVARLTASADRLVNDVREPMRDALTEVAASGKSIRGTAEATTRTLNEVRDELRLTLEATRTTLVEVRRILTAIDGKAVGETVVAARSAMVGLEKRLSSAELGDTIERIGLAMQRLSKLLDELDLAVRASREDFVMSLKHVRQATEDLREFSRIIAQDPSVLVRGQEAKE
jgi:phospholipid/cholesterol/gamma-HCH transport system substrate-binding protein